MNMHNIKHAAAFLVGVVILSLIGLRLVAPTDAQISATPTPLPLIFPSPEPMLTPLLGISTAVPTFTPTPPGPALLQLREGVEEVNVRAEPDPNSERLGGISAGEQYVVIGRYFLWYQILYEEARSGVGFVFGELVDIIGDEFEIPDLTVATPTPPLAPEVIAATEAMEAIMNAPGGELTLAAMDREIDAPGGQGEVATQGDEADGLAMLANPLDLPGNSAAESAVQEVRPTFTYPPEIVAQAPTLATAGDGDDLVEQTRPTLDVSGDVAPIVPILALMGIGLIFFLLGFLQR